MDTVTEAAVAVAEAVAAVEVAAEAVDQDNADTNPVHELLVVPRLPKELGRGRLNSGQVAVFLSVEERWFIHNGLSLQLTASQENPPQAFM